MASPVIVDDRDPRIVYSSTGWFLLGGPLEYDSTTHGARTAGATATFKFTGSSVAVYGTISDIGIYQNPVSTYSIDGSSPFTYTGIATSQIQYRQQFFQSSKLVAGDHTLVITAILNNASLWIDYIEYIPAVGTPSTSPQGPTTTVISTTNPSSTTTVSTTTAGGSGPTDQQVSAFGTPTGSAAPAIASGASGSKAPTGAIVGGVVGAVILLLLIVVFLLFWRRRRRATATTLSQPASETATITPFIASAPSSMVGAHYNDGQGGPLYGPGPSLYPNTGSGYIINGGRPTEKVGLHRSQPSQDTGSGSSRGIVGAERNASEASAYGGIASSKSDSSAGAGPSRHILHTATPHAGPSFAIPQSHTAGSLYQGDQYDTPPAYYQGPPTTHAL